MVLFLSILLTFASFSFALDCGAGGYALGIRASAGKAVVHSLDGKERFETGKSFGLGAVSLISFKGICFVPEISIQRREPVIEKGWSNGQEYTFKVKETGIDIPLMFRFRYRDENVIYLEAGPQIGFIVNPKHKIEFKNDKHIEKFGERTAFEYGLGSGIGFRINKHLSMDFKVFLSLEDYSETSDWNLSTGMLGYTYVF